MKGGLSWVPIAIFALVFAVTIPLVIPDHPFNVLAIGVTGAAASFLVATLGAVGWIVLHHGSPFALRDMDLDLERSSPFLRQSRRWAALIAIAMIGGGVAAMVFAASYYPNPDPVPERWRTPEQYAVVILVGAWFLIAVGTYWLALQVFWVRLLHRDRHDGGARENPAQQ